MSCDFAELGVSESGFSGPAFIVQEKGDVVKIEDVVVSELGKTHPVCCCGRLKRGYWSQTPIYARLHPLPNVARPIWASPR